ncbi:MAG: DMT family transporter [Hyphomicrobiaceae bacterium]
MSARDDAPHEREGESEPSAEALSTAPVTGASPARRRLPDFSQPVLASLYMLAAMAFFVSMGVFIRFAAEEVHTLEVVFFRNFFALLILSPLFLRYGWGALTTGNMTLQLTRAGLNVFGMAAGFTALTLIPLAEATALGFAAPLFASLGAMLILGEVLRARRLTALAVGFVGVMIVLGPNLGGLSLGAALALTNAIILAGTALIVKQLTKTDRVETIILYMVLLSTPVSLLPALFVWTWPSLETTVYLFLLAAAGTAGHYCWTRASSLADVTQMQPLEFMKLPMMGAVGLLIFGEWPAIGVWIGGMLIFASTVYITRREAQIARATAEAERARQAAVARRMA